MSRPDPRPSLERSCADRHGEQGIALLLTILLLLLVSAIGVSALNRAGDEQVEARASRRQVANLAAAEAALKSVDDQLRRFPPGSPAAQAPIQNTSFSPTGTGLATTYRTGRREDPGPQPLPDPRTAHGGGDLRQGNAASTVGMRLIYRTTVTAQDPSGGVVQLRAQYAVRMD